MTGKEMQHHEGRIQKRDFAVNSKNLKVSFAKGELRLSIIKPVPVIEGMTEIECFEISKLAHRQMSAYLGIPAKYYERMQKRMPHLLVINVNFWLHCEPFLCMVRTKSGKVSAFYRVLGEGQDQLLCGDEWIEKGVDFGDEGKRA